jgi:CDP-2,3-bis-(O-geranylgeranyl)-sn-glycerol synthase
MNLLSRVDLLVLVTIANGAPVVAKKLLGSRFALALDGGKTFFDGHPILGPSKTIRGIAVSIVASVVSAPLLV